MEIAHARTWSFRAIAKFILLGLLVMLLAKVILTLLALAVIGFLTFLCARALYTRRAAIGQIIAGIKETFVRFAAAIVQAWPGILVKAVIRLLFCIAWVLLNLSRFTLRTLRRCLEWLSGSLAEILSWSALLIWTLLRRASTKGFTTSWRFARQCPKILATPVQGTTRAGAAALVMLRDRSQVIRGILVEGTSGALLGAMLGALFLPDVHPIVLRICAAAFFGVFLGVTVGLSRTTQSTESHILENQN